MKQLTQEEAIALLKKKQSELGLSSVEFAKRLDVSPQYLANVYGGKTQKPGKKVGFKKVKAYFFEPTGKLDDLVHG